MKKLIEEYKLDPKQITTDNGPEFTSNMIEDYFYENDICHNTTLAYSPNTNGSVERFNRTLKQMIFKWFTLKNTLNWIDVLDDLLDNYNNTIQQVLNLMMLTIRINQKYLKIPWRINTIRK